MESKPLLHMARARMLLKRHWAGSFRQVLASVPRSAYRRRRRFQRIAGHAAEKYMRRLFSSGCLLVSLLLSNAASAAPLRLAGDLWPPYVDASLPGGGVATAVVTAALTRAGYPCEFQQVPWARAVQGIGDGRYDVLVTVWYNDDRTRIGEHSVGYMANRILFWRQRGASVNFDGSLDDLSDYPIAVARGYAYSPAFTRHNELLKVPVKNFAMATEMLAAGRVALALEDERVGRYVLERQPAAIQAQVEALPTPLAETDLRILVSLKTPDHGSIVKGFNQAIADMRADGTLKALTAQKDPSHGAAVQ